MQPHQHEGPVEEVEPVGGVGPPGSDTQGDPWITDRSVEPRLVARPEDGGEGSLGRDAGALRHPQGDAPLTASHADARLGELWPEPPQVQPFGTLSIGECRRTVAVGPVDRELGTESLEDPSDESVVARARDAGLGSRGDPPVVVRGQGERWGGWVEIHAQGGVAVPRRLLVGRSDRVGVLTREPHGRVSEKTLSVRHARDQAALLRHAAEGNAESVRDVRRHRTPTIAPGDPCTVSPLRTTGGAQRSVAGTHPRRMARVPIPPWM
jgi:hypothetical protein